MAPMRLFSATIFACCSIALASDCSRTSVGFVPLNAPYPDNGPESTLGLYPGSNQRPTAHEAAGLALAAGVQPRAANGAVDTQNGRIVLLSIGMSNTTQEFSALKQLADRDPEKDPRVTLVDGAVGGWSADQIVGPNGAAYWSLVAQSLQTAGVTAAQVQTAWIKLADASPTAAFPNDARTLEAHIRTIVQSLPARFPNLKLAYLSSRIYAGYATSNLNPEPYAYQSGFSVKWLIQDQIQGVADVSYSTGKAPWLAWGPYPWADGINRRENGLTWACSDFADDGTHPSANGQSKVAMMLLDFFKTDSTTRPWFIRRSATAPPVPKITSLVNAASFLPGVANNTIVSIFGDNLAATTASAQSLPLPLTLGGTRVEVGGQAASLYFVSPTQINFVLPVEPSDFKVVVAREEQRSTAVQPPLNIFYAPAIFTSGGIAAALHAGGSAITAANPARIGETIELYGTGIAVRNPAIKAPELLPQIRVGSAITRAGDFFGPSPVYPGLYQWNFTIPADAPTGSAVDIQLQYAELLSNKASLAISK